MKLTTVDDVLTRLSLNELSNLAIGDSGSGGVCFNERVRLVGYLDEVLLKLYHRYAIATGKHPIAIVAGQDSYPIDLPLAIKVLKVYSSNLLTNLPINNETSALGVMITPKFEVTLNSVPTTPDIYTFTIQERLPPLDPMNLAQVIPLPDVLWEAVVAYIAFKVYGTINTAEAKVIAKGYFDLYQVILGEIRDEDSLMSSLIGSNMKFDNYGWR